MTFTLRCSHGSTIHEQMDAEHAKVEAVLEAQEKSKSVVALVETAGHPLNQLTEENKSARRVD